MIASKATSPQQGGIALLWTAGHQDFEVEAVKITSSNMLTFQLITGEVQFFMIGAYIPPADTTGVDDLRAAWATCPSTCKPLLLGDLNINVGSPQTSREEAIADLLDDINLINMSQKYVQQRCQQQEKGVRWTWWQQRGVHWHQSQPDYCMAWGKDAKLFHNVAFWQPRFLTLDHWAVVTSIVRGRHGQLKLYRRRHQRFPLGLPPVEEQDQQTRLFGELQKICEENATMRRMKNDWILEESWRLLAHRATLCHTGCLCQTGGRCLNCQIGVSLQKDRTDRTATVGATGEAELTGGNVQEAFRHLKGWYRAATETQAKPCYHTMERQTLERVNLYAQSDSPGDPLPINVTPVVINDDVPTDGELRQVAGKLANGRAAGASGMCAKHVKEWLNDMQQEEDPEGHSINGAGDNWRLFVRLVQAAWTHGTIPCQLLWIIVVLIPKGGGDYCGIGLLEPIWKCIERVIDHQLDVIDLHNSLHGCHHNRRTGTAIIEAKLAQQLSYLELRPFYGDSLTYGKLLTQLIRSGVYWCWKDTALALG